MMISVLYFYALLSLLTAILQQTPAAGFLLLKSAKNKKIKKNV
jgi:hypothetical protein